MKNKARNAQKQAVFAKFNKHCAYCGIEISFSEMQIDHAYPLNPQSPAGITDPEKLNHISNLLPACRDCNRFKSNRSVEEFREYVAALQNQLFRNSSQARFLLRMGMLSIQPREIQFAFERPGLLP